MKDKNILKYQVQIYLTWDGKRMVVITGTKHIFFPSTETGHHPMAPVEA